MNGRIKTITTDKVISRLLWTSVVMFGLSMIYLGFSYTNLPPYVPLFNQAPWGEARLAKRVLLFLPAALVVIISMGNIGISSFLYEKTPLLARMLMVMTFIMTILLFIYYFRTLHLIM